MDEKTFYYKQASKNRKFRVVDWDKIRVEYETTNISVNKLSQKYNVKFTTLRERAYRHKWTRSKRETSALINNMVKEKAINSIVNKRVRAIENHYNISENLLYNIGKALENSSELNTFVEKVKKSSNVEDLEEFTFDSINDKKLLNLVNSFEKLQKSQRLTLGIKDRKEELAEVQTYFKQWLEEEKLKLLNTNVDDIGNKESIDNFLEATKTDKQDLEELFEGEE